MASDLMDTPLEYLDRAVTAIRGPRLLEEITGLDETRVLLIGRTLAQASAFNEVVRGQVAAVHPGTAALEAGCGPAIRIDAVRRPAGLVAHGSILTPQEVAA